MKSSGLCLTSRVAAPFRSGDNLRPSPCAARHSPPAASGSGRSAARRTSRDDVLTSTRTTAGSTSWASPARSRPLVGRISSRREPQVDDGDGFVQRRRRTPHLRDRSITPWMRRALQGRCRWQCPMTGRRYAVDAASSAATGVDLATNPKSSNRIKAHSSAGRSASSGARRALASDRRRPGRGARGPRRRCQQGGEQRE